MALKNYRDYAVTDHARQRILSRFNITKAELDGWMSRLLTQCQYVESQDNGNVKYRLRDIVVIVSPKEKKIVTVYSQNEVDDVHVGSSRINPEVKTVMRKALDGYLGAKRIHTARRISKDLEQAMLACNRMVRPGTNYRYSNSAWKDFNEALANINRLVNTSEMVMQEAMEALS